MALETCVPFVPPVTPLARAGKPRARLHRRGIDRRASVDVRRNNAVAARGPALRHSAAPPVRVPRLSLAGRRVNRRCRFNITAVMQNAQAASGQPARTSHNGIMSCAPACGFVRQAAFVLDAGEALPPPHPRSCEARLRLAALNSSPARPRGLLRSASALRASVPVLAARTPSAPRGSPNRAETAVGCVPLPWSG